MGPPHWFLLHPVWGSSSSQADSYIPLCWEHRSVFLVLPRAFLLKLWCLWASEMAQSSCPPGSWAQWLWRRFSGWQPCKSGSTWFCAGNFRSDGFPGCFPDWSPNDWDDENGNFVSCSSVPRWSTIPSQCLEPKDSFQSLLCPSKSPC